MPDIGNLTQAFAAASYDKETDDAKYPCTESSALTASEAALVKSIFGDEIDTDRVTKYFSSTPKPGTLKNALIPAQTFGEDSIKFYDDKYYCPDYSQSPDIFKFGTYIHEMTHIWQNQNKIPDIDLPKGSNPYQYTLTPQSSFSDFGWEQQAKIIENYARLYLFPAAGGQDPLLRKVVEDRFPQARKTRLALAAQTKPLPAARALKFG